MRLSSKKKAWYPVPNDPDGAEIEVLHLTPGEIEDIREDMKMYRQVMRPGEDGVMVQEFMANENMGDRRYGFIVAAVTGWKNFKDDKGEDMPCTAENKIKVARDWGGFGAFLLECRNDLEKKIKAEKEKELGN